MKKNRKTGYNGSIRASIDSRGKPGFGGDVNIRQQKINFFAAGQVGFRKSISEVYTERTDFLNNATANFIQNNAPVGQGVFGFGRAGIDYFIDNRNTLTISGNMVKGQFKNNDLINIIRDTTFKNMNGIDSFNSDYGNRTSYSKSNFRNAGATISFKHNFAKPNKEISADVNYNNKNKNRGWRQNCH